MLDRSRPPRLEPARPFTFPSFDRYRLTNGLRVILAPDCSVPMVVLRLIFPAGAENDPAELPGLASLTAALLDEGTSGRSSLELAEAVERLGGYLSTSAGWSSARAETSLLSRDLELGLELLADVAVNPSFPSDEVDRLRIQTQTHLKRRAMQASAQAGDALAAELYGTGPYSRPHLGTEASLAAIERDQVQSFHSSRIRPEGSTLVVCGSFRAADAQRAIDAAVAQWKGTAPPTAEIPLPEGFSGRRVVVVDRPNAPQSEICVGHLGLPRSHPDHLVASVLNTLLGGKFTSRINLNLRERHGYTYGAHSYFTKRRGPGPFVVTAAVDNEAVAPAVREILRELERLQAEPVSEQELSETTDYLIGSYPYSYETLSGVVNRLHELAVHDLPDDHYSTLPAALAAVTPDDIRRCAQAHLHPERAIISVAGPEQLLRSGLAELGTVKTQRIPE